jgi:hypothetical protein
MTAIPTLEDMTLKQIRALVAEARRLGLIEGSATAAAPAGDCWPFKVGDALLIRTVTHYYTGRLVTWDALTIVIEEAAWIADTGRYSAAMATGTVNECEALPEGPFAIGRGAIVDAGKFGGKLPRETK